jgi:hypothetical protein
MCPKSGQEMVILKMLRSSIDMICRDVFEVTKGTVEYNAFATAL